MRQRFTARLCAADRWPDVATVTERLPVPTVIIREKYGWQKRLLERLSRGKPDTSVTIAIVDA